MDLKTFVSTTITQICEGVKVAIDEAAKSGAKVNPGHSQYFEKQQSVSTANGIFKVREIEFDVAIAAEEGTQSGGTFSLKVLGVSGESRQGTSTTNRVKFSVPVVLPGTSYKN